jgi:hypothetical protein
MFEVPPMHTVDAQAITAFVIVIAPNRYFATFNT